MINFHAAAAIFGCFTYAIFFPLLAMVGIAHNPEEGSPIYIIFLSVVLASSLASYIIASLRNGPIRNEYKFYTYFASVIFIHIAWVIYDDERNPLTNKTLLLFLAFAGSGFFSALAIAKSRSEEHFLKYTQVFVYFLAGSFTFAVIIPALQGEVNKAIGGSSYQTLSYIAALAFGLTITGSQKTNIQNSGSSSLKTPLIEYSTSLIFLASAIIGGGRGAFVLIVIYVFIQLAIINKNKRQNSTHSILKASSIFIACSLFAFIFSGNEFIDSGIDRISQVIRVSSNASISEATSGRDYVYDIAISGIFDSILLGYGPFNVNNQVIHPHNLFLELVLQFGVVSIPLIILFTYLTIKKTVYLLRTAHYRYSIIILHPLVMLLFSGSYMHSSIFWFCITIMLTSPSIANNPPSLTINKSAHHNHKNPRRISSLDNQAI